MRKDFTRKEYKETLSNLGFSYLGSTKSNPKVVKNTIVGQVVTYSISLLQGNLSGYEVCGAALNSPCRALCLGYSGRAKSSILAFGEDASPVVRARGRKTRLFYEDRDTFMNLLRYELEDAMRYADKHNMPFSVRLNCMSDISPLAFHYKGDAENILQMYPAVQFYDYSKNFARMSLMQEYPNYDITFSYDGVNWDKCVDALEHGHNVAVVFESPVMPTAWRGYQVVSGIDSDLRYMDEKGGKIVYLLFHRTASQYKNGKYERPDTPFVVKEDDPQCIYAFKLGRSTDE